MEPETLDNPAVTSADPAPSTQTSPTAEGNPPSSTLPTEGDFNTVMAEAMAQFDTAKAGGPVHKPAIQPEGVDPAIADTKFGKLPLTPKEEKTAAANAAKSGVSQRKFDGLEEHEKAWFLKMGNEAYSNLYPKYVESKKHAARISELEASHKELSELSMYRQPGAWTLTPEYKSLQQGVDQFTKEVDYWREQLVAIESGQPWVPLVKETGADGKVTIKTGEEYAPDARSKAYVSTALTEALGLRSSQAKELSGFEKTFSDKHSDFTSKWQVARNQILAGVDQAALAPHAAEKLKIFPVHMRGDPGIKLVAEMLVVFDGMVKLMRSKQGQQITAQTKANIAQSAGPGANESSANGGQGNTVGSIFDQFNQYKQR